MDEGSSETEAAAQEAQLADLRRQESEMQAQMAHLRASLLLTDETTDELAAAAAVADAMQSANDADTCAMDERVQAGGGGAAGQAAMQGGTSMAMVLHKDVRDRRSRSSRRRREQMARRRRREQEHEAEDGESKAVEGDELSLVVHSPNGCDRCGKPSKLQCSACHLRRYCGRKCQEKDWGRHKTSCTRPVRVPPIVRGSNRGAAPPIAAPSGEEYCADGGNLQDGFAPEVPCHVIFDVANIAYTNKTHFDWDNVKLAVDYYCGKHSGIRISMVMQGAKGHGRSNEVPRWVSQYEKEASTCNVSLIRAPICDSEKDVDDRFMLQVHKPAHHCVYVHCLD